MPPRVSWQAMPFFQEYSILKRLICNRNTEARGMWMNQHRSPRDREKNHLLSAVFYYTTEPPGKPCKILYWEGVSGQSAVGLGNPGELHHVAHCLRFYGIGVNFPVVSRQSSCLAYIWSDIGSFIFPTQGSNPHLLHLFHCRRVLYH